MMTTMRFNKEAPRCPLDSYRNEFTTSIGNSSTSSTRTTSSSMQGDEPPYIPLNIIDQTPSSAPSTSTMTSSPQSVSQCSKSTHRYHNTMADPVDVHRMRVATKQLLVLSLQAQWNKHKNNNMIVTSLAENLEQALFDMAPTLPDYSSISTLPLRLSLVLPRVKKEWTKKNKKRKMFNRIVEQKQGQERESGRLDTSSTTSHGNYRLFQQLGEKQYRSIQQLVETIRLERDQLVGATCHQCRVRGNNNAPQQQGGLPSDSEAPPHAGGGSFGSKLDPPVAHFFFHTPLLAAWEKSIHGNDVGDCNTSSNLRSVDSWTRLRLQAQANLDAFREWKAQNIVCRR